MAERPWRTEVAPVHRAGWSDDAVPGATQTDTAPVGAGRRRSADPLLVMLVVAGLVVALIKPWGSTPLPEAAPVAPGVHNVANVRAPASVTATVAPVALPHLPSQVFAPAARTCMEDVAWRVCVLGAGGAAIQTAVNHLDPDAAPLVDPGDTPTPADPVLVLATGAAATLAFYAPGGFYIPDSSRVPQPTDLPSGLPAIASGPVVVSAWYVDERLGALWLALVDGGPVTQGGRVAANVLIPAAETFSPLGAWAPGRYIVRIKGVGSRSWEQFFDIDVIGDGAAPQR